MSADTNHLLQQASAALARNDLARGEALLQQARAGDPENPAVLFFLGHVRRAQGRAQEAIDFYKHAIRIAPGKPEAYHHLAQLLRAISRPEEAIGVLQDALALAPGDERTHLELGLAQAALQDFAQAEANYRRALDLDPDLVPASQALSAALIAQDRPDEVEAVVAPVFARPALAPRARAGLKLNLSIARVQQSRAAEGLALIDEALRLAPGLPHADYSRANALQSLGRNEEAERAFRMALRANPLDLRAHLGLNQLLYRMASPHFLKSYDEAAALHPASPALSGEKAKLLFLAGRYEDAKAAFRRALDRDPANFAWREGLGAVLTRLGAYGEAASEYERILQSGRAGIEAHTGYAECLMRAGDAEKSAHVSQGALARHPDHQLAIALWGTALRQLSDPREPALNDYENLVRVYDLDPPEGFSGMADFNEALNRALDPLHADKREHINQTLRLGTKTLGNLFGTGNDLVERLRARIDEAIADYLAQMAPHETHPLLRRRAGSFAYAGSWSVRLADCGFHTNHVHPAGWISSAYYVDVPDVAEDAAAKQGWLKFGEPNFDAGFAEPIRRAVQPVRGRLVLFPSYMWHGTVPFHAQATRTTIAFDVLPRAT